LRLGKKTLQILGYLHIAYLEVDSFGQSTFAEMNALLVSCGWALTGHQSRSREAIVDSSPLGESQF
jgi:hypothetical protein